MCICFFVVYVPDRCWIVRESRSGRPVDPFDLSGQDRRDRAAGPYFRISEAICNQNHWYPTRPPASLLTVRSTAQCCAHRIFWMVPKIWKSRLYVRRDTGQPTKPFWPRYLQWQPQAIKTTTMHSTHHYGISNTPLMTSEDKLRRAGPTSNILVCSRSRSHGKTKFLFKSTTYLSIRSKSLH